jgi:ABC-type Fe3+ transport system substrate-binding protein
MRFSLTKSNITDFGLSFFFEVIKDLVISKEFIETLYKVIIKIARTKLKPLHQVPEMPQPDAEGNEPSEEEKAAIQKQIDDITKVNAEIEKFNDEVNKIQQKVKIQFRAMQDVINRGECALMRVNNYRDTKVDDIQDHNASVESLHNTSGI